MNITLKSLLILTLILAACPVAAKIETKSVTVTGTGLTQKAAIFDAIEQALMQINGTRIAAKSMAAISEKAREDGTKEVNVASREFSQQIKTSTNGTIQGYSILETTQSDVVKGAVNITLEVLVAKLKLSKQLKRLRMAVVQPVLRGKVTDIKSNLVTKYHSSMVVGLTSTRRFAMMDREFEASSNKELQKIKDGGFQTAEYVRLGQKAATDYIVVPVIDKLSNFVKSRTSKLTGKKFKTSYLETDINIRIIDVATTQLKFARQLSVKLKGDPSRNVSKLGQLSAEIITDAIFPARIISYNNGVFTIGQGGPAYKKGRKFQLVLQGQRLIDPYTKEYIGREEKFVGELKITSSNDRSSSAKLVGAKSTFDEGMVSKILILRTDFEKDMKRLAKNSVNISKLKKEIKKDVQDLKKKSKDDW